MMRSSLLLRLLPVLLQSMKFWQDPLGYVASIDAPSGMTTVLACTALKDGLLGRGWVVGRERRMVSAAP